MRRPNPGGAARAGTVVASTMRPSKAMGPERVMCEPSRGPSLARSAGIDGRFMQDAGPGIQIEFENPWNHDDRLGPISVLEHREPQRLRTVDEQAAAKMLLVLNNPVAAVVPTDKEEAMSQAGYRRGRFRLAHDTSPSMLMQSAMLM
jgi:hypothetical protein